MSGEVTSQRQELRCYMRHVRAAGLCSKGSREWCAHYGVDWTDFLANGIPAATLIATRDPIVARIVDVARAEARTQEGNSHV